MKARLNFILSFLLVLFLYNFALSADITREPTGYKTTRVKKTIYPDEPYSFSNEVTYDYGTYIFESGTKVLYRSIWDFTLPTDLPQGSYLKKVELKYNGNSSNYHNFYVGYVESYPSSPTDEQKWNIANDASPTSFLPYPNGSIRTVEVSSLLESIRSAHQSGQPRIYLSFKSGTDYMSQDLVELSSISIKFTYEIRYYITADNNFTDNSGNGTHGSIVIDDQSTTIPAEGYTFYKADGQSTSLQALSPQTNNYGYQMIWNTGDCYKSDWRRNDEYRTDNQTHTFNASSSDNGSLYVANLRQNQATTSGTLTASETWFTNVTLTGVVVVPSGVILTITSCAALNLSSYGILLNGGTVNFEGGAPNSILLKQGGTIKGYFGSIQSAINSASSYQTIELQTATYSESISFTSKNHVTLLGQGSSSTILNNPISLTSSDYTTIEGISLNGTITINGGTHTLIYNCSSQASEMVNNYSGTNNVVAYCNNYVGTTSFGFSSYGGTGDIYGSQITDHDLAVYLTSGATYNVGDQNYFCNNLVDIYATNGGYGYAISNTYSYDGSTSGNVFVTGVNYVCGSLAKAGGYAVFYEDNSFKDFKNANEKYLWLLRKISEDKRNDKYDLINYQVYFDELINEYKYLLQEAKENAQIKNSLLKLSHLYKALDQTNEFDNFIKSLLSAGQNKSFKPYFERYLIWSFVDNEDYNSSIEIADRIISDVKDEDLICEMKYEKGLINKYYLKNETEANKAFAELIAEHPEHLLSKFAANEITDSQIEIRTKITDVAEGYGISAYPNPFNPSTILKYSIPSAEKITIKVFDILGREVAALVNEVKAAGNYTVTFDGSNLSSGVYFYTITAGKFSQTKKMILSK